MMFILQNDIQDEKHRKGQERVKKITSVMQDYKDSIEYKRVLILVNSVE